MFVCSFAHRPSAHQCRGRRVEEGQHCRENKRTVRETHKVRGGATGIIHPANVREGNKTAGQNRPCRWGMYAHVNRRGSAERVQALLFARSALLFQIAQDGERNVAQRAFELSPVIQPTAQALPSWRGTAHVVRSRQRACIRGYENR